MAIYGANVAALEQGAAAAVTLYTGALAAWDTAGDITPGAVATDLIALGRVEKLADNVNGAAGDILGKVKPGVYRWANSAAADLITTAERGDLCYIVDDQTVAKTDGTATRSVAGRIVDVDSIGVWVATGFRAILT
jgi:hypothetical protein